MCQGYFYSLFPGLCPAFPVAPNLGRLFFRQGFLWKILAAFLCLFPETVKRRIFAIIFDKDLLSQKSDYGMVRNRVKPSMQIFLRISFVFCLTNSVSMLRHKIDVVSLFVSNKRI